MSLNDKPYNLSQQLIPMVFQINTIICNAKTLLDTFETSIATLSLRNMECKCWKDFLALLFIGMTLETKF